jgi:hypothetical protein
MEAHAAVHLLEDAKGGERVQVRVQVERVQMLWA